jgi:hypothetical protein
MDNFIMDFILDCVISIGVDKIATFMLFAMIAFIVGFLIYAIYQVYKNETKVFPKFRKGLKTGDPIRAGEHRGIEYMSADSITVCVFSSPHSCSYLWLGL